MFPGIVLDKRLVAVQQAAQAVMKWQNPLNNAGYAVNQDPTKGQHEVIETAGMRQNICQIVVAGASVAPTVELQGSMDGVTWVALANVNTLTGGTLASTDDYILHRTEVTAYTDGTIDGTYYARE